MKESMRSKPKGLTSPYLKSFVVARINPIRFRPKDAAPLSYNEVLERMTKAIENSTRKRSRWKTWRNQAARRRNT